MTAAIRHSAAILCHADRLTVRRRERPLRARETLGQASREKWTFHLLFRFVHSKPIGKENTAPNIVIDLTVLPGAWLGFQVIL